MKHALIYLITSKCSITENDAMVTLAVLAQQTLKKCLPDLYKPSIMTGQNHLANRSQSRIRKGTFELKVGINCVGKRRLCVCH